MTDSSTEMMDKLYLELARFTKARNHREKTAKDEMELLIHDIRHLGKLTEEYAWSTERRDEVRKITGRILEQLTAVRRALQ